MSGISPVNGVEHGHSVYSLSVRDISMKADKYRGLSEEYEILLRQVLSLEELPEALRNRIEAKLYDSPKDERRD